MNYQKLSKYHYLFLIFLFMFFITSFALSENVSFTVIGVKVDGEQNISVSDLIEIFNKNGFRQEKTDYLDGMIFIKKTQDDNFVFLTIEATGTKNEKKYILEAANAKTGVTIFFDILSGLKDKKYILDHINNTIKKIERTRSFGSLCEKLSVNINGDQIIEGKDGQLLIDIKFSLFKNKNISYINRVVTKGVLDLQDYVDTKMNKFLSGHLCPVNIWCYVTYSKNHELTFTLVRTEDQKKLNEIKINSESDINKLIVEILKYKKI